MEFTEAQEVDYIVAQSISKNIFANANGQVNNRQKSAKFEQLSDSSDDDEQQTQFQSKQGNGMNQSNRQKENQTSLISNLLKSEGETETMDEMLSQINSIVSSQYEQKKKQFEEEQERIKMLKEIMQQESEEQKKMEIAKTNSILFQKSSGEKADENGEQNDQKNNGLDKSSGVKNKEKQKSHQEEDDSDEDEDDDDEDYDEDDDKYNNRQNRHRENSDNNEDKFEQVPEECIIQSFTNVVLKNVSLLKNTTQQKNSLAKLASNPKAKRLDVYFFGTSFNMKVPYDENTTIQDFIKIIIDFYMADPNTDKSLMRYPKYPQAYNLRMKDDDGYKPDTNLGPIDPKYPVQNFSKEQIVIMEIDRFVPPMDDVGDQVAKQFKEKSSLKGLELLIVIIEESGAQMYIQQSSQSTIKQVLEYIRDKKNAKIVIKDCIVSYFDPQEDKYTEIDLNTPISQLPSQNSKKIRIKKKEWADTPRITNQQVQYAPNLPAQILQSEPISNMNLVKYEEFNVIKINDKKKRQERVLGIDQHKILNINKRIQQQDIGFLNKIFVNPQTGTKNPSRKIEDIQFIQELENNIVIMKVKDPDQQYDKTLKYEISNPEDRRKIIKKIEGLMELCRKDNLKKMNMNIMNNINNINNMNYMNNMTNVPNMMTYSNYNNGTTSLR